MIVDTSTLIWSVDSLRSPPGPGPTPGLFGRIAAKTGWAAPELIRYELLQVIHRKRRAHLPGPIQARNALRDSLLRPLEIQPADEASEALAAEICERVGCSGYDAVFLANAGRRGQTILTADKGMAAHAAALNIPVYLMPRDLPRLERDFPAVPGA